MMQLVSLTLIDWIVTYPVESANQLLNNWGQSLPNAYYITTLPSKSVVTEIHS